MSSTAQNRLIKAMVTEYRARGGNGGEIFWRGFARLDAAGRATLTATLKS